MGDKLLTPDTSPSIIRKHKSHIRQQFYLRRAKIGAIVPSVMKQRTLLRHLRRDRELTLQVLSERTGIDTATLSRAERNLVPLTDERRAKLAEYFGVPGDVLQLPYQGHVSL